MQDSNKYTKLGIEGWLQEKEGIRTKTEETSDLLSSASVVAAWRARPKAGEKLGSQQKKKTKNQASDAGEAMRAEMKL